MTPALSRDQLQKAGIIYESIILILMPAAQSIPLLFSKDGQASTPSHKTFLFFSVCVAGANLVAHLVLSFIRNRERASVLKKLLRITIWYVTIINILENQMTVSDGPFTSDQLLSLSYSVMGVYIIGVIQLLSLNGNNMKKIIICFNVFYISLRIAIQYLEPILGIFGGLLCLVALRFLMVAKRIKSRDSDKLYGKELEIFLLKALLANADEGYIVLQNNKSVYYTNQKALEILQPISEDIVMGLEQIKRLDALSDKAQKSIKKKSLEQLLNNKEDSEDQFIKKSSPGSFAPNLKSVLSPIEGSSVVEPTIIDNKEQVISQMPSSIKPRTFFTLDTKGSTTPSQKKSSFTSVTMSKFKPVLAKASSAPYGGPKGFPKMRAIRKSIRTSEQESKVSRNVLMSEGGNEDRSSVIQITKEDPRDERKYSESNVMLQKSEVGEEEEEEYIFSGGVPVNLSKFISQLKPESVLNAESPYLENSVYCQERKHAIECTGYVENSENQVKMLDVKVQPVQAKRQQFLIVRVKETVDKESYVKQSEKEKINVLSSVSHELRTPLNCIISMLDIVGDFLTDDLKEEYIQPAAQSAKLLLCLINDILDYAQSKAKTLRLVYSQFDLKQNLVEVIKLMTIQARSKGLELILDFDDRAPRSIYSEPNRIRQVVINLIGNALKFTLRGSITVKVDYIDSNVYRISISDTGVGIKTDKIGDLFRQFSKISETSHINQQGVGLGLSISNTLAKMLSPDGKGINVDSVYGEGTTFSFEIESKKQQSGFVERLEFDVSSDREEVGQVSENINELKEQHSIAQNQKSKVFNKKRANDRWGRMKNREGDSPQKGVREQNTTSNNAIGPTNVTSNNKIDQSLYVHKTFRTLQSSDDKGLSIDLQNSFRSKSMVEEKGEVVKDEEKNRIVGEIAKKLNKEWEDPWVLVVDDNAFNIIALTRILGAMKIKIDSAVNGDQAIQKILEKKDMSRGKTNYKLVLMDCCMPIKDGYETTKELRDLERDDVIPQIPIIAVTASNSIRDIDKCYESGMDDYLMKPINIGALKDVIIKYLKDEI